MCIEIVRNNCLVDGRARAESNPGHWARHALLHMAAECVNHSATKAGQISLQIIPERIRIKAKTEIADEHAGFQQGKGAKDQITNLRILTHKAC